MNILWLSWKDITHPQAGGAEALSDQLLWRLAKDGHHVRLLTARHQGAGPTDAIHGYEVVRRGGKYTVYLWAAWYVVRHLRQWPDVVVEEVNTIPFLTKLYARQKKLLFFHQLAREIWFYEFFKPLAWLGYLAEPLYLRLLSNQKAMTVSQSSKQDLQRHGFRSSNIQIISEGSLLKPVKNLTKIKKFAQPTLLSFGAIRPMKRTAHQIRAFELAKERMPDLQCKIAGSVSGAYGKKVLGMIKHSPYAADIEYLGRVSEAQKARLMQQCHLIMVTSVKEGWGLIVTEVAAQGTPAVVYDVDGLRDSVRSHETGMVCAANTPQAMADTVAELLQNKHKYDKMKQKAWKSSKKITFEHSYSQLKKVLNLLTD